MFSRSCWRVGASEISVFEPVGIGLDVDDFSVVDEAVDHGSGDAVVVEAGGVLTEEAASAPAGSEGVLFAPWLDGERSPVEDKEVRGAFVGLSLRTDRATMIRAAMEGVALNSRWLFDVYEKFCKRRIDSVRILGGGAQSDLWCAIYAGVLDRPVEQVAQPRDAQMVGAAQWARVCLGETTLAEAAAGVRVAQTFDPRECDRGVYQEAYAEYRGLYKRLKGLRRS